MTDEEIKELYSKTVKQFNNALNAIREDIDSIQSQIDFLQSKIVEMYKPPHTTPYNAEDTFF